VDYRSKIDVSSLASHARLGIAVKEGGTNKVGLRSLCELLFCITTNSRICSKLAEVRYRTAYSLSSRADEHTGREGVQENGIDVHIRGSTADAPWYQLRLYCKCKP
jgi:hypothetical protein